MGEQLDFSTLRRMTFKENTHLVTIRHEQNSPNKNHKFLQGGYGGGGVGLLFLGRSQYCWSVLPPSVIQHSASQFQLLTHGVSPVQLKIPEKIGTFLLTFALNFAHS